MVGIYSSRDSNCNRLAILKAVCQKQNLPTRFQSIRITAFGSKCVFRRAVPANAEAGDCFGAGALIFQPKDVTEVNTQTRDAFIYGAGADLNITRHVFIRAQYRGFAYNSPTWDRAAFSGFERVTHRSEPSIRFGYRF